jgi:hypothetical protein
MSTLEASFNKSSTFSRWPSEQAFQRGDTIWTCKSGGEGKKQTRGQAATDTETRKTWWERDRGRRRYNFGDRSFHAEKKKRKTWTDRSETVQKENFDHTHSRDKHSHNCECDADYLQTSYTGICSDGLVRNLHRCRMRK